MGCFLYESERNRVTCGFTPQKLVITRLGQSQGWKLGIKRSSPMWIAGMENLGNHYCFTRSSLVRNRSQS